MDLERDQWRLCEQLRCRARGFWHLHIPTKSAVGISRSGTESLREALFELGYDHTTHGFDTMGPPCTLEAWYNLDRKKYTSPGGDANVSAQDFDQIIGHCMAITDLPAARIAPELIAAYPDAKVVLNTRDVDSWYRSFNETMVYWDRNAVDFDWVKSWFWSVFYHILCLTFNVSTNAPSLAIKRRAVLGPSIYV